MENKKLTWKHYLGIAVVAVLVIYLVIGFTFSNKSSGELRSME